MDKRKQLEDLSREMLGLMEDVTAESEIFFPFGYKLDEDIEKQYFPSGNNIRVFTSRRMIVVDNSFKKFKIFPSEDIMKTYVETQKELLSEWYLNVGAQYRKENPDVSDEDFDKFKDIVKNIADSINQLSIEHIRAVAESDEAKSPDINSNGISSNIKEFLNHTFLDLFKK